MSPGRRWYTVPPISQGHLMPSSSVGSKAEEPARPRAEAGDGGHPCAHPLPTSPQSARTPPRPYPASGLGIDFGVTGRLRKDSPEPVHLRTGARCVPADRPPPGTTDSTQHPGVSTTAIVPVGCTRLLAPAEAGPCAAPFKGSQKTSQHYGPYSRSNASQTDDQ